MRKSRVALLTLLFIAALYLPEVIGKPRLHKESLNSLVEILVYYEAETKLSMAGGTGFVLKNTEEKTMIATCEHVVDGSPSKIVVFANDEKYPAEIIRTNDKADLAIISIDAVLDKQPLTLSEAGLFSTVYAAGYPGSKAYDHSIYFDKSTGMAVTEGRVNFYIGGFHGEPFQVIHSAIEDFGSSGGPLLNHKGNVVGVIAFGDEGYYGATTTWELKKLCKEAGVEYTYRTNLRLLKDLAAYLLVLILVVYLMPDEKKKTKAEEKIEK